MVRVAGPARRRSVAGFSLVEAVIAVSVSSLVVILAASVFLIQNDYYGFLLQRARVQDSARAFLDVVEREVGSVVGGGLVEAEGDRMVVRVPQSLGAVCAVTGVNAHIHWASWPTVDPTAATGFAVRDSVGAWSFHATPVNSALTARGPGAASQCARAGADTTRGGTLSFVAARGLNTLTGRRVSPGDVVMIYEEVELSVGPSLLDPVLMALYRGPVGGTPTEYATGVGAGAGFQYRVDGSWRNQVGSTLLARVDAVRIRAETFQPSESGIGTDARFLLSVDIPLRNR